MLAAAGEEDEFIKCFDDVTGKELPWQAKSICVNLACVKTWHLKQARSCDKVQRHSH